LIAEYGQKKAIPHRKEGCGVKSNKFCFLFVF
jgi:hypothetical protein